MDASLNLFTQLYAANMLSDMNANGVTIKPSKSILDRIACHKTLIHLRGENVARESLMSLLLQAKGDAGIKRRIWDEFDMAIDSHLNFYKHF